MGAPDDIWQNDADVLAVVDYKATAKQDELTLDADWQNTWKRQIEVYQWLLRQNGFNVSDRGYFVYTNADKSKGAFNDELEFETKILPYDGSDDWVSETLEEIREVLMTDVVPKRSEECDHCQYREAANKVIAEASEDPSDQQLPL